MRFKTADLCDELGDRARVAEPIFRAYGRRRAFHGLVWTVKVHEDNLLVREALEGAGEGRVLVVDGGGSTRCALLGDRLARLAIDSGWAGVVIYGCLRDSAQIDGMDLGVRAVGVCPRKSRKAGEGQHGVTLRFAGVEVSPGDHLYADEDGLILTETAEEEG